MEKCVVVYTPFSYKGKFENHLNIIQDILSKKYEVSFYKTKGTKDATKFAKENGANYDVIVVAGGDGLINEVVNGLMEISEKPKLGILPMGTVNDISHSFNISQKLLKALDVIVTGKGYMADVLKINDFYSTYVCCLGQYTSSTYNTKQDMKKKFGWLAYFLQTVKGVFKKQKYNIDVYVNDKVFVENSCFTMCINSRRVAGFMLNKYGILNDGEFDLVAVENSKGFFNTIRKYFIYLKLFVFGIDSLKNSKGVKINKVKGAKIVNHSDSVLNVDGEGIKTTNEINVSVVKSAIRIIVPIDKKD